MAKEKKVDNSVDTSKVKGLFDAFLSEYGELVKKHGIDYAIFPQFVPDGNGGFRVTVSSTPIFLQEEKDSQGAFIAKK